MFLSTSLSRTIVFRSIQHMPSSKESAFLRGHSTQGRSILRLITYAQFTYQHFPVLFLSTPSSRTIVLRFIKHVSSSNEDAFLLGSAEVPIHIGDTDKGSELMLTVYINNLQSCSVLTIIQNHSIEVLPAHALF